VKVLDEPNEKDMHDCKSSNLEDNILHMHDLLSDTASGKVAGPFKISENVDHVITCPRAGIYYKVPLIITPRFCTIKTKRLQLKGRRVSDLTKSGVNYPYMHHEKTVSNLPTLRFIVSLLNNANWLIDFDYSAAYRQMPYDCRS